MSMEITSRIEVDGGLYAPLVNLWMAANHPENRRAKIQVQLLEKDAVHCCSACGSAMSLDNYRETNTPYETKAVLACNGCALTYVIQRTHHA